MTYDEAAAATVMDGDDEEAKEATVKFGLRRYRQRGLWEMD